MLLRHERHGFSFATKNLLMMEADNHGKLHKYAYAVTTQPMERQTPAGPKPSARSFINFSPFIVKGLQHFFKHSIPN